MAQEQQAGDTRRAASSRDQQEIDGFSALADQWWESDGPFAPLHQLNPARVRAIATLCSDHFSTDLNSQKPFKNKTLWDVGCGGGLVAEPMARMGFNVIGMDASAENIRAAQHHAEQACLSIEYRVGIPEELPAKPHRFDVVLALEVIEHVADIETFVNGLTEKVAPGGVLLFSTINRSLKSMAMAKVAAEYLLRWVPAGTHTWSKFVKPSELAKYVRQAGFNVTAINGLSFNLANGEWTTSDDVSVNYIIAATPA